MESARVLSAEHRLIASATSAISLHSARQPLNSEHARLERDLMTYDDLCLSSTINYWARDRVLGAIAMIRPEQFISPGQQLQFSA